MESNNKKELETLIHRLREWAIKLPQKVALRYCDDKGKVIASRTYDELNRQTYKIAVELREKYKYLCRFFVKTDLRRVHV